MSLTWILEIACMATATVAAALAYWGWTLRGEIHNLKTSYGAARKAAHDHTRELELENDRLRGEYMTLLERSGMAVLVLDGHGVIQQGNSHAGQWLGVPALTLAGQSILEASLSNDLQNMFLAARREGCIRQEVRLLGHMSEYISLVTIAGVSDLGRERERFVLIAQDVTHLRHLETVRRDFVANVSHELRTPLTSIRAIAETLQNGALDDRPTLERFLGMIVAESERLTRISNDLLTLSAAESRVPERALLDLSGLVTHVAQRFQGQAGQAHVTLTVEVQPALELWANRDQIEQVIVNLLDNAIKYTSQGGQVRVLADRSETHMMIHVSDTGIGILHQDVPRIFERFYRVDKARSRESGGTGLGLSIVKHMAEAHGGQVTVESEFNHGSVFTVTLPVANVDDSSK